MQSMIELSGNVALALDLTNKLLDILPTHQRALGNKVYYEDEMQKTNDVKRKGDDGGDDIVNEQVLHLLPIKFALDPF